MPKPQRILPIAAILAAVLTLAGCGGGPADVKLTVKGEDGSTVFQTDRFTLVFEGQSMEGSQQDFIRLTGPNASSGQVDTGSGTLSHSYRDGETTIQYAGHNITITEGKTLSIDGDFSTSIEDDSPRIVIGPDGKIAVNPDD